jgi:hypothetical protein
MLASGGLGIFMGRLRCFGLRVLCWRMVRSKTRLLVFEER